VKQSTPLFLTHTNKNLKAMIHTYVKVQDQFSFAFDSKIITVSEETFAKMLKGIGDTFNSFDKKAQIRSTWKVLEVRQATEQDYINTGTPYFVNQ
jgi:hypothetical protein